MTQPAHEYVKFRLPPEHWEERHVAIVGFVHGGKQVDPYAEIADVDLEKPGLLALGSLDTAVAPMAFARYLLQGAHDNGIKGTCIDALVDDADLDHVHDLHVIRVHYGLTAEDGGDVARVVRRRIARAKECLHVVVIAGERDPIEYIKKRFGRPPTGAAVVVEVAP